ncbi:MAG: DUF1205 domain-containing protein [Actinomycetota bacterium]|nr:DUF1205 domain-containing protein [Actinomycetota bacterium]
MFTIFPGVPHLHPVVPLAWALVNEGHEVRVAVHPRMGDSVTRTGLSALPFGDSDPMRKVAEFATSLEQMESLESGSALRCEPGEPWHDPWFAVLGIMSAYLPATGDLIAAAREWQPDLIIWDPVCPPGAVAAKLTGAAHARLLWSQDNVAWLWERFAERDEDSTPPMVNGSLGWLTERLCDPYGLKFEPELLLGQFTIDPRPAAWGVEAKVERVPMRWVPYNGSAPAADWLARKPQRPRVALSLGIGGRGRQVFAESGRSPMAVISDLASLDIELVCTLDRSKLDGDLPDNVRVVDYVPLNQLLPTCSAILHHGGDGTAFAAGAFAVPQLVLPVPFWAEHNVGRHITDIGAGLVVTPAQVAAGQLRGQLDRLLTDPAFTEGAARQQAEMRAMPAPHDVVRVLTELTERHRAAAH